MRASFAIDKTKLRMIVFDVDGTMAETDEFYYERVSNIFRHIFFFLPAGAVNKCSRELVMTFETFGHLIYVLLDKLGIDRLFSRLHEKVSGTTTYKYEAICGLETTINQLHEKYRMSIITSGGEKSTAAFLDKFSLQQSFEVIVSAQTCSAIKPSPLPLLSVMEQSGLQSCECLMVGDTIFDILTAHRAGVACAAVKTGFDNSWLLRLFRADVILDSVADLPAWLASQN